ncbi:MAG: phosphate-starvation-inducible E [gamma proteobacterium symbiont of Ctena orbiculata]|uniref:Protein PsiE n=1 Tax=Candidatus Thiodiazotropha taylori TaxID=2792791 RepID=A0A944QV98_9GAMM|nr:phosphate-starvation-inducible PsiE family protein [Candidatus Thiodiazotropha taylori]PUB88541.1 MAG: phosphate-starvation-inducible E [gamma proteobacterium symbiont of Ctena orbiculata]MBT2989779.1 phosphate-starvation-inducible PsiE family protein [Candidatus Thiodiazotropha taylori]MBT2995882.1 phosphate-starvation-inducible PsiE family protein [Candidatus Thiodiazotropha taylori]MBT2999197.1 phosphate-starvation-inducible PsiE family protein [Candidatus Thiodiazotropha taylori]
MIKSQAKQLLEWIEDLGLVIITIATLFATGAEIMVMVRAQTVTLADLLLLFIYLEVFTMVKVYLDSGKLPVRIPLYIAIVALARYMILDMKAMDNWRMLAAAGASLVLAFTILAIRYGHTRFPYGKDE